MPAQNNKVMTATKRVELEPWHACYFGSGDSASEGEGEITCDTLGTAVESDTLGTAVESDTLGIAVESKGEGALSCTEQRYKSVIEESAAEFVCPIMHELPMDPVMAEDGHVYERKAIEEWFACGNGKSPVTNSAMGSRVLPAVQVKNMIVSMVKSGVLSGKTVDEWQQRLNDEGQVGSGRAGLPSTRQEHALALIF